jgi:hypothetical protein
MAKRYTDSDIADLLAEQKLLPSDYQTRLILTQKRGHKERELQIEGSSGNRFVLMLRQNDFNVFDFSVILGVVSKETNAIFRLRRYNGKSHEHTNRIEGNTFYNFHIHTATERYQDLGAKEEHFAEVTDRYGDLFGAVTCMLKDCGFIITPSSQTDLFEGQIL